MDKIKNANELFTTIGLQLPKTTSASIRSNDSISYYNEKVKLLNHKGLHGKLWEGELINNSSSPAQICAELEKITMQNTKNIKMARKMMNYGRK